MSMMLAMMQQQHLQLQHQNACLLGHTMALPPLQTLEPMKVGYGDSPRDDTTSLLRPAAPKVFCPPSPDEEVPAAPEVQPPPVEEVVASPVEEHRHNTPVHIPDSDRIRFEIPPALTNWVSCKPAAPPAEQLAFQLFTVGYGTSGAQWKPNFRDMISKGPHCVHKRISTQCRDAKDMDIWFDSTVFTNPDKAMF